MLFRGAEFIRRNVRIVNAPPEFPKPASVANFLRTEVRAPSAGKSLFHSFFMCELIGQTHSNERSRHYSRFAVRAGRERFSSNSRPRSRRQGQLRRTAAEYS